MSGTDAELLVGREGGVLRLTLNRPAVANAMTAAMREGLISALTDAAQEHEIRAVVVSANGKHFCSGADVANISGVTHAGDGMQRVMFGAQRLIAALLDCPKPIIASVQGTAAGLGAHIAFASDLVIASQQASFIEIFVKRGICVDAGGAWLLPRLVGLQRAKELVFFGERVTAEDAMRMGLANRVVAAEMLEQATREFADRLATGPTLAIGLAKRQLNKAFESDRASAFLEEAMAQEITSRSGDATEGVKAFLERREPKFGGI